MRTGYGPRALWAARGCASIRRSAIRRACGTWCNGALKRLRRARSNGPCPHPALSRGRGLFGRFLGERLGHRGGDVLLVGRTGEQAVVPGAQMRLMGALDALEAEIAVGVDADR